MFAFVSLLTEGATSIRMRLISDSPLSLPLHFFTAAGTVAGLVVMTIEINSLGE